MLFQKLQSIEVSSMKYRVYFYYDKDYEGYVADALDLPGCVSQGKTEVQQHYDTNTEASKCR
jgi:hypothetical protein